MRVTILLTRNARGEFRYRVTKWANPVCPLETAVEQSAHAAMIRAKRWSTEAEQLGLSLFATTSGAKAAESAAVGAA